MSHRPVLPPRKADWKKGNYQVGLFMRTADGGVVQLSINDANATVCSLASQIIAEAAMGKEKPARTSDEWHPGFGEFLDAQPAEAVLQKLNESTDDELLEVLSNEVARRNLAAANSRLRALARSNANQRVRAAAVEALWRLNATEAGSTILDLFHDQSQPTAVRDTAAYALGRLRYLPAFSALKSALPRETGTVANCVVGALEALREAARQTKASNSATLNVRPTMGVRPAEGRYS